MPRAVVDRLSSWQAVFDDGRAEAAHLVCDRWEPGRVAFVFMDSDRQRGRPRSMNAMFSR